MGGLYVLVVLFIVFSLLRPETFPTVLNIRTMLISQAFLGITALGLLFPAVNNEFDLSLGFLSGFVGVLVAWLSAVQGWSVWPAVAAGVAAAVLVGFINGYLVVKIGIVSLIATLGIGTLVSGLTLWVSGGRVIFEMRDDLIAIGRTRWLDLQVPVYVMLLMYVVAAYIFHMTAVGKHMYANGGNRDAARMSGIATDRLTWMSLVVSGTLAGIGGILYLANIGAGSPEAGEDLLLPSFAAIFLGSTLITPGKFNVAGTATALALLVVLVNGIQQLGAPHWVQPVFNGLALVLAVAVATIRGRKT
jgi:ribose transport system permease protein